MPPGHENLELRNVPVLLWIPARLHNVLGTQGNCDIWNIVALGHCSYAFLHYTLMYITTNHPTHTTEVAANSHMGMGSLRLPPLYGLLILKTSATASIKSIGHPPVSQIRSISHPLVFQKLS